MSLDLNYKLRSALYNIRYAVKGLIDYCKLPAVPISHLQTSLVVVGRNDDYMPNFYERLKATLAWNIKHLITDPIFVEWNPPVGKDLLAFKLTREFPTLRVFIVPNSIHVDICQNNNLSLMEYHAKNVGIRRARSEWIIASNADVAFSPNIIIASQAYMHRANEMSDLTAFVAQRIDIRWDDTRKNDISVSDCMFFDKIITPSIYGTGDFLMASQALWNKIKGYDESLYKHRIGCDVRGTAQMMAYRARTHILGKILHLAHPTSCTQGGIQPHHGENATLEGIPYSNQENWGLGDCRDEQIGERIWQLV